MPLATALFGLGAGLFLSWVANSFARKREEYTQRVEVYSELLMSVEEYSESWMARGSHKRYEAACTSMNLALARVDLLAPARIYEVAQHLEMVARLDRGSTCRTEWLDFMTTEMRKDISEALKWHLLGQLKEVFTNQRRYETYRILNSSDVAKK